MLVSSLIRSFLSTLRIVSTVAVLILPGALQAGQSEALWSITPEPAWGSQATGDPAVRTVKGGKYYHLSEHQERFGESHRDYASYLRYTYTITSASGLDDGGYLMIDFDPAFETVQLHKVLVYRGDEIIDMLDRDKIQLLQRETDLDQNLYNGQQSLHLLLDDQRVNDKIEVSYTTRGRNPVFDSKVFGWAYLQAGVPVGNYYFSISYPQSKTVKTRVFAGEIKPVTTKADGYTTKTWDARNVPARKYQSDVPYSHIARTLVQYSEFESWPDVASWLRPVYKPAAVNDPRVVAKANEIKEQWKTEQQQIAAAIQFVQDRVRYTGINSGIGGWVPDNPGDILARRFGDCKDKSVLLTALLRELGVEAHPVLVDTREGEVLSRYLPTPTTFDHMIVHIPDYRGRSYWIDPTRSLQGIGLDVLAQGYYDHALIPAQPERGLVQYERPFPSVATKSVLEEYRLHENAEQKPSTLIITSTFRDSSAEYIRRTIEESGVAGLEEDYLEYYRDRFEDIVVSEPMVVTDNREQNVLVMVESYQIDNVWLIDEDNSNESEVSYDFFAYADAVTERFSLPQDKRRHQPLYQSHPVYVEHKIRLTDRRGWDFENHKDTIENDYFVYNSNRRISGNTLGVDFTVKSRKGSVSVEDSKQYIKDLKKLLDSGYFSTTYAREISPAETPTVTGLDRQLMSIGQWFSDKADKLNAITSSSR